MDSIISCSPRRIVRFLSFVGLGLILASVIGQLSKYLWKLEFSWLDSYFQLFNLDGEKNIPSFYSTAALLFCSILLATIALIKKINQDRYFFHWGALATIFLFLSADEWLSLHEKMGKLLGSKINASGIFHYAWVIPGAILVFIVALAYLKFLTHLPRKTRRLFLTAASLFVSGAIGMELAAGYYVTNHTSWSRMIWMALTTAEEALEFAGVILFIYALLSYMSVQIQEVRIRIGDRETLLPTPEKVKSLSSRV